MEAKQQDFYIHSHFYNILAVISALDVDSPGSWS